MVPNMVLSRSQTITVLVNEKASKMNGRLRKKRLRSVKFVRAMDLSRVPYELVREEQWADCEFCDSQGEVEIDETKH